MRVIYTGVFWGTPRPSTGMLLDLGSSTLHPKLYGFAWRDYIRIA